MGEQMVNDKGTRTKGKAVSFSDLKKKVRSSFANHAPRHVFAQPPPPPSHAFAQTPAQHKLYGRHTLAPALMGRWLLRKIARSPTIAEVAMLATIWQRRAKLARPADAFELAVCQPTHRPINPFGATEGRQSFSVSNNSDRPSANAFEPVQTESKFNHDSAITVLKTYQSTKRALIRTRRGGNRLRSTRCAWFREIDFSHEGTPPPRG